MKEKCILIFKKSIEEIIAEKMGKEILNELAKGKVSTLFLKHGDKINNAEVHKKMSDFFLCLSGEILFSYEGELVNPWKENGDENELRAKKIKGEGRHEAVLKKDDMLFIPAGQPHQYNIRKGSKARLQMIKIPAKE